MISVFVRFDDRINAVVLGAPAALRGDDELIGADPKEPALGAGRRVIEDSEGAEGIEGFALFYRPIRPGRRLGEEWRVLRIVEKDEFKVPVDAAQADAAEVFIRDVKGAADETLREQDLRGLGRGDLKFEIHGWPRWMMRSSRRDFSAAKTMRWLSRVASGPENMPEVSPVATARTNACMRK